MAYGVVGAFAVVVLFSLGGDEPEEPTAATPVGTRVALPYVDSASLDSAPGGVRDADGPAGFEALLAEGEAAAGTRVRTTLYCEPMRSVAIRRDPEVSVHASVMAHAGSDGRVPGAECQWGSQATAPDVLLIVPAALAQQFASMPEVEQSFVRRREVPAVVEWIGRSEALALRNVAVLQSIEAPADR